MRMTITSLESPIDVMYGIHAALRAEGRGERGRAEGEGRGGEAQDMAISRMVVAKREEKR